MAVNRSGQGIAVEISWPTTTIQGINASIARAVAGVNKEVSSVPNDGAGHLYFATGHHADETITVSGSKAGADPGYAVAIIAVAATTATVKTGDGTIEVTDIVKRLDITWDVGGQIHGADVVLTVNDVEQSIARNTGRGSVFCPIGFSGLLKVGVHGSHQGSETAELSVS